MKIKNLIKNPLSVSQHLKFLDLGYAILMIDGRGSANRGVKFEGHLKNSFVNIKILKRV